MALYLQNRLFFSSGYMQNLPNPVAPGAQGASIYTHQKWAYLFISNDESYRAHKETPTETR
jgi:hypothetical protein